MTKEEGRNGRSAAWGMAAGVLAVAAIAMWQVAIAPNAKFPILPAYICGFLTSIALYMCFGTAWGWWPTARRTTVESGPAESEPSGTSDGIQQKGKYVAGRDLYINRPIQIANVNRRTEQEARHEEPSPKELRRARITLLHEVRRIWVDGVLDRSLEQLNRIELGITLNPAAIQHRWQGVVAAEKDSRTEILHGDTPVGEIFQRAGNRLLILGSPGSGKTTFLLELVRRLLEVGERDSANEESNDIRMPIVFHLSSWQQSQPDIESWIVDELHKRYGVSVRLGRWWIDNDDLLPLFDGLDEVAPGKRPACIAAINTFCAMHGQLGIAVACRKNDYETAKRKLHLNAAIDIQPLRREAVHEYLNSGDARLLGLRSALERDRRMWDLLTTPLMLSIASFVYKDMNVADIARMASIAQSRNALVEAYIRHMLTRPTSLTLPASNKQFTVDQVYRWLGWLAFSMRRENQSVFYIDWLQPSWLPRERERITVARTASLVAVVITTPLVLTAYFLSQRQLGIPPIADPIVVIVIAWLINKWAGHLDVGGMYVRPAGGLSWSWAPVWRNIRAVLANGARYWDLRCHRVFLWNKFAARMADSRAQCIVGRSGRDANVGYDTIS